RSAAREQAEDQPARLREDDRDQDGDDGAAGAEMDRPDSAAATGILLHVAARTAPVPEHVALACLAWLGAAPTLRAGCTACNPQHECRMHKAEFPARARVT